MPKEYSHLYLGRELLAELTSHDGDHQFDPAKCAPPFLFGNTAPDLFFYDFPTFRYRVLARLLHRGKGEKLLEAVSSMIEMSKASDRANTIYAFALGCLAHLAADMTWHPFVLECCSVCSREPKAPECPRHMACHFRIETCLDLLLASYYGTRLKKKDFPRWIYLSGKSTKQLLEIFCDEINRVNDTPMKSHPGSAYRCLLTQVLFLALFQVKPLFWASLAADFLTLKKYDLYQALFYPPSTIMRKQNFVNLSPGLGLLFSSPENIMRSYISRTKNLAQEFFDVAQEQKKGALTPREAYEKFLNISPTTGVDGHL